MNKKILLFGIIIIILAISVAIKYLSPEGSWICESGQWVKHGNPGSVKPSQPCPGQKVSSFEECAAAGYPIMESYPRQCRTPDGQTFSEVIDSQFEKRDLIRVDNPRQNQTITSPLTITGQARGNWFFEAVFPIKLYDSDGSLLATAIAQTKSDWMTEEFVPFTAELEFKATGQGSGFLVLEKDNPSGLPEYDDQLQIPILFSPELITVEVYFNTPETGGPPDFDCSEVAAVERQVVKTQAVGRAALEELLKGPSEAEKESGYLTSINPGVKIQSLIIENGIARVDFDEQLQFQVGGSCRVAAIRSQISKTLKQFPTVDEVIISINGRSEDILQP